jgi:membrane fusion protein, heavy metal efflux system
MTTKPLLLAASAALYLTMLAACGASSTSAPAETAQGESPEAEEYAKGPHGGRLLEDGDFTLEVTIFETGVPPEYRLYPFVNGEPADPASVDVTLHLHRLGGIVDEFAFAPRQDYLRGDGVVTEPHSFEVEVAARRTGKSHAWRYESFEGRTAIPDEVAAEAGIVSEVAGPMPIGDIANLSGTIELSPSATADVRAKYPGPVTYVGAKVGDTVRKGQVLARVESSSSLQEFTVVAPASGTVIERNTNVGDVAGSDALFVIANFDAMEARLHVFPDDVTRIKPGQPILLGPAGGEMTIASQIARYLPVTGVATQTRVVTAPIPSGSGLQPGMRILANVTISEAEVPLAVKESGLQSFRDFTVVYAKVDDTYEVRMLDLGRSDGTYIEVLGGLRPGEVYVSENSFLIKADIEKSGASHDH